MEGENVSKSAKKNQKRKEKNSESRKGDKIHVETPAEQLERLKKEFEIAKATNDQETVKTLRQQIWVLSDLVAGVRTNIPDKELAAILQSLNLQSPAADTLNSYSDNTDTSDKSEPERRLRNLQKRLKQISELKAKQKKGDKLELNQIEKIQSEAKVREEIEELEAILKSVTSR